MPPARKNRGRLTPLDRLVTFSIGRLMGQRRIFARHGKNRHGLKVEDAVVFAYVRLSKAQGKVITATSLAADLFVLRRTVAVALLRLVEKGLIVAKEKEGREVVYENPPGYSYPPYLLDDIVIELVADQIVVGDRLKALVAELDDPKLKQLIEASVNAAKNTAFYLT